MSESPTEEEVRKSIEPKSNQLNADDLLTGPLTVTISKVSRGDRDQPIVVDIEGHRPYKPCKSMRRVLIAAFSDDPKNWVGQRMTLYCDPDVTWAGVRVGGIRISHLSIDEPKTFLLTQTRGKKAEVTIRPIAPCSDDQSLIAAMKTDIANAETLEVLSELGTMLSQSPKAIRDAVRGDYARRQKQLKDSPAGT